jgi:hypothetical protein
MLMTMYPLGMLMIGNGAGLQKNSQRLQRQLEMTDLVERAERAMIGRQKLIIEQLRVLPALCTSEFVL